MSYEFKTKPFSHQQRVFEETRDLPAYGLLWEQGTGKTKPTIDTAGYLYEQGKIDAVLLVAPSGVHRNWVTDEIPTHLPDRLQSVSRCMYWRTPRSRTLWHQDEFKQLLGHKGLAWLCIGYDGFMSEIGKNSVWKFLSRRRCLYILDESHHVKTPKAKRTRSIVRSGHYAPYRRILTGTPADKPFDIYSQLRFLDPDLWARRHMATFAAFKQHYGEWFTAAEAREVTGYDPGYDKLLRYKNLEELNEILQGMSDRVLKEDVLDLPPKLYTKRYFDMHPRQQRMYSELHRELELELESGAIVDGTLAIVRLLRLQQIACGYVVADAAEPVEKIGPNNPRLDLLVEECEVIPHQAIIWCRFRHDVDQIVDALGASAVRYDGAIDEEEAARSKEIFNAGDAQWLVANPAKGAEGLTLNGAKTSIFYSNSFKLLERLQAEDRNHRIGQDGAQHDIGHGVLYMDLCANGTVDEKILQALRDKFDIASQITGDELRAWI